MLPAIKIDRTHLVLLFGPLELEGFDSLWARWYRDEQMFEQI